MALANGVTKFSSTRPPQSPFSRSLACKQCSQRARARAIRAETSSLPSEVDVVVVGAGLAGLNAAVTLQKKGLKPIVLEASDGVGGRTRTDKVDGFLLDRGFQIFLTGQSWDSDAAPSRWTSSTDPPAVADDF